MTAGPALSPADQVATWRDALRPLDPNVAPVPGFLIGEWPGIRNEMARFLRDFGEEAVALGYDAIALFGVHRHAGAVRVDSTGALVGIKAVRVRGFEPGLIRFENGLAFRGVPNRVESVPIWAFRPEGVKR